MPEECAFNIEEYKQENSPVIEFWNECTEPCLQNESCVNTSGQFYNCFRVWTYSHGLHYTPSFPEFRQEISNYIGIPWTKIIKKKNSANYFIDRKFSETGKEYAAKI